MIQNNSAADAACMGLIEPMQLCRRIKVLLLTDRTFFCNFRASTIRQLSDLCSTDFEAFIVRNFGRVGPATMYAYCYYSSSSRLHMHELQTTYVPTASI